MGGKGSGGQRDMKKTKSLLGRKPRGATYERAFWRLFTRMQSYQGRFSRPDLDDLYDALKTILRWIEAERVRATLAEFAQEESDTP